MAINGKIVLAVVPARGGSKSIPRKNLAIVHGKSLIEHAANTILQCKWIDKAVLSTDDTEIKVEGERCGLSAPFLRPDELSSDTASSIDMWQHAWSEAEAAYNTRFDISLLIEPTSPLRQPEDLRLTAEIVACKYQSAAATISINPAHFTPHKTLTLDEQGIIGYYIGKEGHKYHNRHLIPTYYHRNGICYAVTRQHLLENGKLLEKAAGVIIDHPIVNIDEPFELELAEWLMQRNERMEQKA
jgi:CMP-N-acetylneuraminic acid synthetase